ncbi:MAG: translocation/assembly module TamB domain-containing protein, partial [Gammaproteobacteria bacterium]
LAALLDDDGASLSVHVDAAEAGSAEAALVVDNPLGDESPLQGSLDVEWRDVAALSLLSPDIDGVQGRLDANLNVGGTLAMPELGGSLIWSQGALEVPAWGLLVDQVQASIAAPEGREAVFSATGLVDGTPLEVGGTVLLDPEQGWPMQLELSGEDLSLVQLADIEMRVSPNLEASVRLPDIDVQGSVVVPYARIRDVTLPQQAVVPSPDTIVHGAALDDRGRPLNVVADLALELGDDVTYQDANLNAAVTGRLDLDYRSGQGAAAQGALTLTGEYNAYGNPLALQRGQLIFVGPLNDPSLDILAVREIGEVSAGVQLTGTLRSPITTLFSEPAMSETDALSWLLFGRPLDSTRGAEADVVRNAALSMGLQQALPFIERIGESLRLDDFAIRTTETDTGALMAGKYLNPNLYFRYSYGLFNRIGGLLLRYRINDQFSLETRSGEHNSMDLLYTLEKD